MRRVARIFFIVVGALVVLLALLFVGFYLGTSGDYPVARTVAQDSSLPSVELDGAVFHCETFGRSDAPTVVVIHGGPGLDYRYLLPLKALADEYLVVFYDQRGTGLSPRVGADELTVDQAVRDLDAIVDHFGRLRPVRLVGHSWGAMLASAYLVRHPDKVTHAVLAEPGFLTAEIGEELMARANGFMPEMTAQVVFAVAVAWFESLHVDGPDDQAGADHVMAQVMTRPFGGDNPMVGYFCDGAMDPDLMPLWRLGAAAATAFVESNRDASGRLTIDFVRGVERFTRPVLLLASECNALTGVEHQRRHLALFRDARLATVRDAGHFMVGEQPEQTLGLIRGYFAEPL